MSERELAYYYNVSDIDLKEKLNRSIAVDTAIATCPELSSCNNHAGKSFNSVEAMCKHYKVKPDVFRSRLAMCWSLRSALCFSEENSFRVYDHKGLMFPSISSMGIYHNMPPYIVDSRLKRGWNVARALTVPIHDVESVTDHLGNKYQSMLAMATKYGINEGTLKGRLSRGWDIERALTTPSRKIPRTVKLEIKVVIRSTDSNLTSEDLFIKASDKINDAFKNYKGIIKDNKTITVVVE